jgi:hypothetical protein
MVGGRLKIRLCKNKELIEVPVKKTKSSKTSKVILPNLN